MSTNTSPRPLPLPFRIIAAPLVWLERSRGRRRTLLILAYLLVAIAIGLVAWRYLAIATLPDVGDPFDVAAFERECRVPDDRNAFIPYREALAAYQPMSGPQNTNLWGVVRAGWSKADPDVRRWSEANQKALTLWRRGAERPEAFDPAVLDGHVFSNGGRIDNLEQLAALALLEGARDQEEGDPDGAWAWYRLALRSAGHVRRRGGQHRQYHASGIEGLTRERIVSWALSPTTDAASLRRALKEVVAFDAATPPVSEAIKADYVAKMAAIADPEAFMKDLQRGGSPVFDEVRWGYRAGWFLKNEPVRSRRVLRLIFANQLAQCDRPLAQRPKKVQPSMQFPGVFFYDNQGDPNAPAAARAIDPKGLIDWLDSTMLAWRFSHQFDNIDWMAASDRSSRATMIVNLAEQLYAREHGGASPPSVDDLVGPYLDRLPDSYNPSTPKTPEPTP